MTGVTLTDGLLRAALAPDPSLDTTALARTVSQRIHATPQRRRGLSLPWQPSPAATLDELRRARLLRVVIAAALLAVALGVVAAGSHLLPPPPAPPQWLLVSQGQALTVPLDGGERQPLVAFGSRRLEDISVSWDGKRFATVRGERNAILEVWDADAVFDDRETLPIRYDLPPGLHIFDAGVWRQDGKSLLLSVRDRGAARIHVLDLATGDLRQLSPPGVSVEDWQPAPNDRWLEILGVQDGRNALFLLDLDTGETHLVLRSDGIDIPVAGALGWSPDSSEMTVAIEHRVLDRGIWAIRSDSFERRRVTPPGQDANGMSWSPDGAWIMYVSESTRDCPSWEDQMHDTWVVRQDGTDAHVAAPVAFPIRWADDSRSVIVESQIPLPGAPLGGVIAAPVDGSPPDLVYPYTAADTSGHRCHLYGVYTKKYAGSRRE